MLAYVYALMDLNEEAVEEYRRTIHQSPTYVKAYYNLEGNCYLKSGHIELALDAYQTIVDSIAPCGHTSRSAKRWRGAAGWRVR